VLGLAVESERIPMIPAVGALILSALVPYQFEFSGSLVGPPGPLRVWPITTEAQRRRVWPTWQGRRWQRETATSYVIREAGLEAGAGLTMRLRVRAKGK
jgi:hypothetical protein